MRAVEGGQTYPRPNVRSTRYSAPHGPRLEVGACACRAALAYRPARPGQRADERSARAKARMARWMVVRILSRPRAPGGN